MPRQPPAFYVIFGVGISLLLVPNVTTDPVSGGMLLLHISDIHFREPDCLTPALDPDRPFRTRMIQDIRNRIAKLGPVGAILITGDIAFKGHPSEYVAAKAWIDELVAACSCSVERVFVVPGNHDVDRGVIVRTPAVRNAHAAIMGANEHQREREFRAQFTDPETGRTLMKPLDAYNDFAKFFSCQIYAPDHPFWKQDLPLEGGVNLRLNGLTSVFVSGAGGGDDKKDSLYLGPMQTALDPVDDVVNLVMIHHPPDWFCDGDDVDEKFCNRSAIHLFGHKHRQRITKDDGYVRFGAGAVNPDRREVGWQPAYNLIDVRVEGDGANRTLVVDAHQLQWQANPELYRPALSPTGEEVFRHRIPIPGRLRGSISALPSAPEELPRPNDVEAAMSEEATRNLVFRFWQLTASQRREIVADLDLTNTDELKLPEPERYGRALLRAAELGRLEDVAREVSRREGG